VALLVKANKIIADPEAAATLLEAINRMYEMQIDTKSLNEEKERIGSELEELSQKYMRHRKQSSGMYM